MDRFHSLLAEWQLACTKRYVMWLFSMTDIMSTTLMFGGLLGAFIAGFLADRYGRKPLVVGMFISLCMCVFKKKIEHRISQVTCLI